MSTHTTRAEIEKEIRNLEKLLASCDETSEWYARIVERINWLKRKLNADPKRHPR